MKKAIQLLKIIIIIHFILNAALVALLISDESTTVAIFLSISSATVLIELYAYREIISTSKLLDAVNPLATYITTIRNPYESFDKFLDRHYAIIESELEIKLAQNYSPKIVLGSIISSGGIDPILEMDHEIQKDLRDLRKGKLPHEHKWIPIEYPDSGDAKFICSVPGCGQTC